MSPGACNYTWDIQKLSSSTSYSCGGAGIFSTMVAPYCSCFTGNAVIVHGHMMARFYGNRGNAHRPVNTGCYNNPAGGHHCIMRAVVVADGSVNMPCQGTPGVVPNRARPPGNRRNPYYISRCIHIPYTRPGPYVHYNAIG
jgi:hypothetical protein